MNKQEILTKAIEKAEKNKFNLLEWWDELEIGFCPVFTKNKDLIEYLLLCKGFIPLLLTDHTFARALWGEEQSPYITETPTMKIMNRKDNYFPLWQYHLQQMVISDDWLAYVEGTLDE